MSNVSYVALSRQIGLQSELTVIANNVANISTTGYRRDASVFSEYIRSVGANNNSVSQSRIAGRVIDSTGGAMMQTGGTFDIAITGRGYFMVDGPDGDRLTRAGAFLLNSEREISMADGRRLLGEGGAPIAIPPDAQRIAISGDGAVSVDDVTIARIGVVDADPTSLVRESGAVFMTEEEITPVEDARINQGFLESSNVNPVLEISRLIEVQRAFEMGQQMASEETERLKRTIETIGVNR